MIHRSQDANRYRMTVKY